MKPYWENAEHGLSIHHGDCLELLRSRQLRKRIGPGNVTVITDPPWPRGAGGELRQSICAVTGLLRQTMNSLRDALQWQQLRRCVIHLGCDTDPRILEHIPLTSLPFLRLCTLEYAVPHRKGRLLYDCDVAYVFGEPPASRLGAHLLPRRCMYSTVEPRIEGHPHPRRLVHVKWLVQWFTEPEDTVLDPFSGSATTLLAAYHHGRPAIGIEIEESYCELAAKRLEAEMAQLRLVEPAQVRQAAQLTIGE